MQPGALLQCQGIQPALKKKWQFEVNRVRGAEATCPFVCKSRPLLKPDCGGWE